MFSYFKSSIQVSSLPLTNLIVSVLKIKKNVLLIKMKKRKTFDRNHDLRIQLFLMKMFQALHYLFTFISVCFTQNLTMRNSTVNEITFNLMFYHFLTIGRGSW